MKVAIYCRVSTEDQELKHQVETCVRFCEYKQFEIAKVYSEKISGVKSRRPEYLKLVADLRNGLYAGVVVFRLDRLGRNARELALFIDELENKGIRVFSVNESFDTSTAMGRAMREIIIIFAQLERDQISEATSQRLQSLKSSGKRLGQKPLSDYQVLKVKELHTQGLSCRKIAGQMQLGKSAVYNVVHQKGYYSVSSKKVEK
jgi:DNA invertase Pin-like site-specific DNA recombinase